MTLEEKLIKLQSIQQKIEQKTVSLSESIPLLEEAYKLKNEIEKELKEMENKIITLTEKGEVSESQ
jgi:exodeoxyribonuclease VII small subunit